MNPTDPPLQSGLNPPPHVGGASDGFCLDVDCKLVLRHLPEPVMILSLDECRRVLFINNRFTEVFGYGLEDIPTDSDFARRAYPDPAYRKEVSRQWNRHLDLALASDGVIGPMEFEVTAKDGAVHVVLFHATRFAGYLQVTLTDVTPLRSAQNELNQARREIDQMAFDVIDKMPAGLYSLELRADGSRPQLVFASSKFFEICGFDREAVHNDLAYAFDQVHEEDRAEWDAKNADAFANKLPFSMEVRLRVGDGIRWVHCQSTPCAREDGSFVWQGAVTDITARKYAEEKLAAMREEERRREVENRRRLERKLRMGLVTSAIAHEINQPLGRIRLATFMESKRLASESHGDSEQMRFLEAIKDDIAEVVDTMHRIRSLMRAATSNERPFDLSEAVDSAVFNAGPSMRMHEVRCHVEDRRQPCRLCGDMEQVQIAIHNVLRNSIDALVSGNEENESRKISVGVLEQPEAFELRIGDNGPGFHEDFRLGDMIGSTKSNGFGLGLLIVRTVMENHHGHIEIGRSPLGGAEVCMVFPKPTDAVVAP